ncbi:hypothetical protein ACTXT7_013068 [Hymenolepis weldensis]
MSLQREKATSSVTRGETVEEILNSLQFSYRTAPHVGIKILVHHRKHLRSQYATLSFKPKRNPAEVYPDSFGSSQPWNSIFRRPGIIDQIFTVDASEDLEKDSMWIQQSDAKDLLVISLNCLIGAFGSVTPTNE